MGLFLRIAGYYVAASHSAEMSSRSVESLTTEMTQEIIDGAMDGSGIKCGVIGEIGCTWPLHGD